MVLGFFMILVDSTIVSVATPAIMIGLDADVNAVVWVTSAYLLAYAVPLLITGRLGDRYGPKNLYLIGLTVFTLASLWCGLTGSIAMLVIARIVQGLGASMLTPQTMAVITRTFPAASRGRAMALWGATAGVAMLVGPIAGGLLIDGPGWEWIFFVNVPVGVIGLALAVRLVPRLETHTHSFDWVGVALSAIAMFLLVFGVQEGESYDWGTISGIVSVPLLIGTGLLVLAGFVWWQGHTTQEPLVPLSLFRDRNFSISTIAISAVGFSITAMAFPFFLYTQAVRGMTPTASALLLAPVALLSGGLAPLAGKLTDRLHPRGLTAFGLGTTAIALIWLSQIMHPDTDTWVLLLPMTLMGLGNSFMWSPLGATATRNLPMAAAGAGAGIFNTTRQGVPSGGGTLQTGGAMPAQIAGGFADAMAQSMLLPVAAVLVGFVSVLFYERPTHRGA